jgi:hypothetical protein
MSNRIIAVLLVSLVSLSAFFSIGCAPKSAPEAAKPVTPQDIQQHADHQKALGEMKKNENR